MLLKAGDVLVRNVSRVMPARLRGHRESGRDAEVLLVHADSDGTWLAMVHPGGKLKPGRRVRFGDDAEVEIVDVLGGGLRRLRWSGHLTPREVMSKYGEMPLPPYIQRRPEPEDWARYQTIFASREGSVAAPTAGLHFTSDLLEEITRRGVRLVDVVLHVGPGTFKPVETDDPAKHTMLAEWYTIPAETAEAVNAARAAGGRVWAVGTTTVRTLETAGASGALEPSSGWTNLFIHPPYDFRQLDALLTNFHRPRSTLLMLVAAFAGLEFVLAAYREAIRCHYRLFSYGDAMAIE
jgi:S-adenosylmethionine:tRNA ribosyltransferase-isomerase